MEQLQRGSDARPGSAAAGAALRTFAGNQRGRDFVVGDVHGMFRFLRALLDRLEFDTTRDRLFSVGDLVDRGPESRMALEWLDQPWFHAVRGNHEQFAIDSDDPEQLEIWLRYNGGGWWEELCLAEREEFRHRFLAMPLAMEVETEGGRIGIVHADIPPLVSWDRFVELLELGDPDAVFYAMWSRNRIQGNFANTRVPGRVERVYCGHTPIREVLELGNVHYIDTGAVYSLEGYAQARLTVIEIHPEAHREHAIETGVRP